MRVGITVGELLKLPEVQGITLLAGTAGLGRLITDVSVLEIPDRFERWIRGHELILTTLYGQPDPYEAQERLVRSLHGGGVAALGLHPGPLHPALNRRALALADTLGFPMLLLPEEMPYAQIFHAVLGEILNRQAALLQRSEAIHRRLTDLLLAGGGYPEIVAALAELLRRPVAFYGPQGAVRASAGEGVLPWAHAELRHWFSSARVWKGCRGAEPRWMERVVTADGQAARAVALSIRTGQECHGFVLTWVEAGAELEPWERVAVEHAATALALRAMQERVAVETERRLHAELVDLLAAGRWAAEAEATERAARVGMALDGAGIAFFAVPRRGIAARERNRLADAVRVWLHRKGMQAVVALRGEGIAVLLAWPSTRPACRARDEVMALGQELLQQLEAAWGRQEWALGLGPLVQDLHAWAAGIEEAQQAARIGQALFGPGVYDHEALWPYRLLLAAGDMVRTPALERSLALLGEGPSGAELLRTLHAYLECSLRVHATARRLFVHPNTVRYRIRKVEERLGAEVFEDAALRFALHLAVKRALLEKAGLVAAPPLSAGGRNMPRSADWGTAAGRGAAPGYGRSTAP